MTKLRMALLSGLVLTASCGTSIAGTPNPTEFPVDITKLNMGTYSSEPLRYELDTVAKPADVRTIEAKRYLDYMINSTDVDPIVNTPIKVETYFNADGPFSTPVFPDQLRGPMADNKLMAGAYVARTDGSSRSPRRLILSVLRFPSDAAAQTASEAIATGLRSPESQDIALTNHPEVHAFTKDWSTATATTSQGNYAVLISYGRAQPDQSVVMTNLAKAVDLQLTKLKGLSTPEWEDVLDKPLDPDGIMRRAFPQPAGITRQFVVDPDYGAHTPDGAIHYERNPDLVKKALAESGTDLVGRRGGIVYRTRDLNGAFQLQLALTSLGRRDETIPGPPQLPDTRCIRLYEPEAIRSYGLICAIVKGRYVAVVGAPAGPSGTIDRSLYERAAAQYALLAKSE
ncbi:DUF7373 family lipoprotein [Nocardia camponoti]|uniref:Uncharacterized protein n=1 Tax=Nocardia camponoti TaxID=1616106 RepID=A0A917QLP5_9NOCA|nr:hypothetical protein [Nocardia camponoti]GGK57194.1 hypothetical protein GCM10011591_31640 [Nocardia camponoti]